VTETKVSRTESTLLSSATLEHQLKTQETMTGSPRVCSKSKISTCVLFLKVGSCRLLTKLAIQPLENPGAPGQPFPGGVDHSINLDFSNVSASRVFEEKYTLLTLIMTSLATISTSTMSLLYIQIFRFFYKFLVVHKTLVHFCLPALSILFLAMQRSRLL
jgi:hypothetical protein